MKLLKKVHVYLYVLSVVLTYYCTWPFIKILSLKPSGYKAMNRIRRGWAAVSSGLAGFFFKFEYEEPIDWSKTYIICPNHTSNLDIAAMCVMVKNDYCFMGKEELKDGIVTGLFFKTVDIPVNRDSKMSAFRAFKAAGENIKNGTSVVIFPEGGISDQYPPSLQSFKNGPFKLAIELKVPIIPVSSADVWEMLWDDGTKHGTKPGICNFYVHKPIDTINLTAADADELRDRVYGIINKKLVA
jgi:1-acyl-sn-glycerol-3-phosphate acyltransferase